MVHRSSSRRGLSRPAAGAAGGWVGACLEGRAVGVRLGGVQALDGVDIAVGGGEIVGLIGPNGAGKTTLINVLSGFQRPTEGTVWIDGTDATALPPHRRARLGLVRTFQQARVFPGLTVRENVEMGALATGRGRRAAVAVAEDLLHWAELTHLRDHVGGGLPHGIELQVGILRSLAASPTYLLLDEPAAGLNESESDDLTALLRTVPQRNGCGVLLVEHDTRLVFAVCDRVHVLNHGRTLAVGSAADVRNDKQVIEAYLGVAS